MISLEKVQENLEKLIGKTYSSLDVMTSYAHGRTSSTMRKPK